MFSFFEQIASDPGGPNGYVTWLINVSLITTYFNNDFNNLNYNAIYIKYIVCIICIYTYIRFIRFISIISNNI